MGQELPEELKASLRIHNGERLSDISTGLLFGYRLLSLEEMVQSKEQFLPLTAPMGHKQWLLDKWGAVYLMSGWNFLKKADGWLEVLSSLVSEK
jgi:hypothetical protein